MAAGSVMVRSFTGIRSDVRADQFAFGGKEQVCDLEAAVNVDILKGGRLKRRAGVTEALAAAGSHSLFAQGDLCLYVQSGALKRLSDTYTASTLRTGMANTPMAYVGVNDCAYYANGHECGVVQAGVSRSWGLPTAPLPSVTATVGHMPAGDYQFAMTYLRADGQEGGCGVAGRITLTAGAGIVFGLPAAPSGVAAMAIYLTTANGETLYRALLATAGDTSATYRNDTTELRYLLRTQFMGAPPAGHVLAWHAGTVLVADGDTIYQSEPLGYELFDWRKYLPCDGDVRIIAPLEGEGVFIATDKGIGFQRGDRLGADKWLQLADHGAVRGTLTYVDGALFGDGAQGVKQIPVFLATTGFVAGLPGGQLVNLTRARYPTLDASGDGAAIFNTELSQLVAVTTS